MLFAGVLALLMRVQLAVPENDFLTATFYNQLFTLHGTAMMFLFAVPIFEAVAIILLPLLPGARDLPFPRLSAFGFWCFLIGGVFVCGSIFFGAAPSSGWFMYPLLTTKEPFTPGLPAISLGFFAAASEAVAIPTGVQIFVFLATLLTGGSSMHCRCCSSRARSRPS